MMASPIRGGVSEADERVDVLCEENVTKIFRKTPPNYAKI